MISRIKTDEELIYDAAIALAAAALGGHAKTLDDACLQMVETLRYARSISWWDQFGEFAA